MAKPNVVNKQSLLEFAKECLVENGIEKFTLRAVAERANVTQGTVYYHFRTKEQLLLDIVKDICDRSWNGVAESDENVLEQALQSAKSRCSEQFFHKLFLTMMVTGFNNEKIREQLGAVLEKENKFLADTLSTIWPQSPIKGVSSDTWAILCNSMIDGIALQALMIKNFPVEEVYKGLGILLKTVSKMAEGKE